jgi:predicted NBD/HSP70 family sugar kinase
MQSRKPKSLKIANMGIVLELLRNSDQLSIAEISGRIGLSKTTVSKIIEHFLEVGLLVSIGKGESTDEGGKRPELFTFNRNYGYVISLHVTPEMLRAAITDLRADITHERLQKLDKRVHVVTVVRHLADMIREFISLKTGGGEKLLGVVVALPGLVDPARGISIYSPHYPAWGRNVPLREMLHGELGSDFTGTIHMDCVNRYQAFAESAKGQAVGMANFMIMDALDEGLGGGIVVSSLVQRGSQYLSGEVGHMILSPDDNTQCICGARGCFEAMVSAKRVLRLVREGYPRNRSSLLFKTGQAEQVTLEQISECAAAGDKFARTLIEDVARWYALALSNIAMVTDPELIVLQGVYTRAGDYFVDRVRARMSELGGLPDVDKRVRLEYSTMGEERGSLGAAAYVICRHFWTAYPDRETAPRHVDMRP